MALTQAEKRKIEEEEEYRSNLKHKPKPKRKIWRWLGALTVLVFAFAVFYPQSSFTNTDNYVSLPTSPDEADLIGAVNFDGNLIHIANLEDRDWKGCLLSLNGDYKYPGAVSANLLTIRAGETIDMYPSELTLKNGTKFNPYTTKLLDFAISCGSRFGYWSWN